MNEMVNIDGKIVEDKCLHEIDWNDKNIRGTKSYDKPLASKT